MLITIPNYSNVIPKLDEVIDYLKDRKIKIGSTTGYTK